MRLAFFISALRPAGAERVMTSLANAWSEKGVEVCLITLEAPGAIPFYPLAPEVNHIQLGLRRESGGSALRGLWNNLTVILALRKTLRRVCPDILISFIDMSNMRAILATRGLKVPVIISERTDPSKRSIGLLWHTLRKLVYPLAEASVFQSQGVADWFPPRIRARARVIPNPVQPPPMPLAARDARTPRKVVALGRLHPVKGFDTLIQAFADTAPDFPQVILEIWGEGPERANLQSMARDLGVASRVFLRGLTPSPFEAIQDGDLFVLPSRAEGFPNALVEAMACGLPVISTDFGGAARDIVQDGLNGILVPPDDPGAMAKAMAALLVDPEKRTRFSRQAPLVMKKFSTARVLEQWEELVVGLVRTGQPSQTVERVRDI